MQFHLLYDSYVSYHSKGPPSTLLISIFQSVADEMPFHQLCDLYEPYHRKGPPLYTKEVQPSNVLHFFQSNVSHSPYVLIAQFDDSYLLNLVDTIVTLAGEYALQREPASLSAKPVLLASPFARGAPPPPAPPPPPPPPPPLPPPPSPPGPPPPPPPPSLARDFSRYSPNGELARRLCWHQSVS